MMNDVTVGHPTSRDDVIVALGEVLNQFERGNDDQALHLLDVLTEGVARHPVGDERENGIVITQLVLITEQIEENQGDVEDFIRELSNSLRTA